MKEIIYANNKAYQLIRILKEDQLKDYNKIALPPVVFDDIYEAIEGGVSGYDFSDTDNYNIEYGIEYDGKVYCENLELQHSGDLVEIIVKEVSKLFVEATEEELENEELNTTEPDHHKPVETQSVIEEVTVDGGETEVTVTPTEDEMKDFNKKVEKTKEKSFKKRTWF